MKALIKRLTYNNKWYATFCIQDIYRMLCSRVENTICHKNCLLYIQLLQASDVEPQHLVVREGGGRDEGRRKKQILHASQFQHVDKKKD